MILTNMKRVTLLIIGFITCCVINLEAESMVKLSSPNGKLEVKVSLNRGIEYEVYHGQDKILNKSSISIQLMDGSSLGSNPRLKKLLRRSSSDSISAPFYKRSEILDEYNEMLLQFRDSYDVVFRAYDEGVAYRFISRKSGPLQITNEQAEFNFPEDFKAYIPYIQLQKNSLEEQMYTSFENTYSYLSLSEWDKERLAFLPLLVEHNNGKKVCITEADLIDYPGMFLNPNDKVNNSLKGVFANYPKRIKQGGHNNLQEEVVERESYLAKYKDGRISFPWRVMVISENDVDLLNSDIVYKLATPADSNQDFSWVKPGKVAWDWWNNWNIYGVDFESGINNDTYKYYIDFASKHGIEYVILDEGWAVNLEADLFQVVPEINLKELIEYATIRNVGIILWAGYYAFKKDMEEVCKYYSSIGVKGFKIDFMDRDDQEMVQFHVEAAKVAAEYNMLVNFHGTYKPTGLHRTYPNVINYEGVHGLEQMKWAKEDVDQVTYDVTFPFIRMLAGPIDYTQGAMRNAAQGCYRPINSEPMSQGTRCRQLAEYIVFESPLNMLCDSPSNYLRELECLSYISDVPTVWDETMVLEGVVSEYITIARRKGEVWYVGSLNNWESRDLVLDLSFLGDGDYTVDIFKDGINANKKGSDYERELKEINNKKLNVHLAPGGGCAIKIYKK